LIIELAFQSSPPSCGHAGVNSAAGHIVKLMLWALRFTFKINNPATIARSCTQVATPSPSPAPVVAASPA
jgi:hypothetical protein